VSIEKEVASSQVWAGVSGTLGMCNCAVCQVLPRVASATTR
jgi:hypothetical protein